MDSAQNSSNTCYESLRSEEEVMAYRELHPKKHLQNQTEDTKIWLRTNDTVPKW
jgi:hypothetical protein